jgi:hypothetical protein
VSDMLALTACRGPLIEGKCADLDDRPQPVCVDLVVSSLHGEPGGVCGGQALGDVGLADSRVSGVACRWLWVGLAAGMVPPS